MDDPLSREEFTARLAAVSRLVPNIVYGYCYFAHDAAALANATAALRQFALQNSTFIGEDDEKAIGKALARAAACAGDVAALQAAGDVVDADLSHDLLLIAIMAGHPAAAAYLAPRALAAATAAGRAERVLVFVYARCVACCRSPSTAAVAEALFAAAEVAGGEAASSAHLARAYALSHALCAQNAGLVEWLIPRADFSPNAVRGAAYGGLVSVLELARRRAAELERDSRLLEITLFGHRVECVQGACGAGVDHAAYAVFAIEEGAAPTAELLELVAPGPGALEVLRRWDGTAELAAAEAELGPDAASEWFAARTR